jgi:two-component system phosphate regulon sensor histidine kinase PhoR
VNRTWRERLASIVALPTVLVSVAVLAYFALRTTLQIDTLRKQSVIEATLALVTEKANRLDQRIVAQDNVVVAIADPENLADLRDRWVPTAQRETPTIRAIVVLDDARTAIAFASRAGGSWGDEERFRRLLVQKMVYDMNLAPEPPGELRHLHREYGGESFLVSYWQRAWEGRTYLVVAWHDIGRIVKDTLPSLYTDLAGVAPQTRVNVVDEDGRIIFGPPLRSGEFTVGVRFPTTLYNWRIQVSPAASEELAFRVQNRRTLEMVMFLTSCVVIVAAVVVILIAAEKQRRISALKSEFVANVSHELKTPLALVRMFGEMLQSGRVSSEDKRQEYLEIIVRESERLSNLIENVLDFARVERGREAYEFNEGDVGEAVTRAANVYRYRAEREGVELAIELPDGPLPARIDARAVQLAIINLVDNALKYAPESDVIVVRAAREGGAATVRVIDKGPGVLPEDRARIFERFVRGTAAATDSGGAEGRRAPVRGSGIGLALVKHIAEAHGGTAWVESVVGQGSAFLFTIPLADTAKAAVLPDVGEGLRNTAK